MRRSASVARSSGRTAASATSTITPVPLRIMRISKMFSRPASPRIDIAMVQNDRRAPVIQKTTRPRLVFVTMAFFLGRLSASAAARADHSASGWFSGRALSKAASFRHASFAARINGNASSGTLNRCALATCGTRQTSASVTCAPQQ